MDYIELLRIMSYKSSCAPPRGTPRVMLSTEGAKANYWRYNQSDFGT